MAGGGLRVLGYNVLQLSNRLQRKERSIVVFATINIVYGIGFDTLLCPKIAYPIPFIGLSLWFPFKLTVFPKHVQTHQSFADLQSADLILVGKRRQTGIKKKSS